jgi:hypothetical protein
LKLEQLIGHRGEENCAVDNGTHKAPSGAAGDRAIAIPSDARKLGEFIANLLGQRRRLSRYFDVTFFIDWLWIQTLDQLVVQRVEHQNEGGLVDFSFKLFLSNGRITHLTTRADFHTFRDLSGFECTGVELIWTFVIKFPTSTIPEKQEIRFIARTDNLEHQRREKHSKHSFADQFEERDEEMLVEIFYSNITWGEDLLQLISNHVFSSFSVSNRLMRKIIGTAEQFAMPFVLTVFMLSFFIQTFAIMSSSASMMATTVKSLSDASLNIDLLNAKLDLLITQNSE